MENNKEKILRKIKALIAKANDEASTDAETIIFMGKAQELINKHKISDKDINASSDELVSAYFSTYIKFFKEIDRFINIEYLSDLCYIISKYSFCRTIIYDNYKEIYVEEVKYSQLRIIGKKEDVENVLKLLEFSYSKFFKLANKRYKEEKHKYLTLRGKKIKVINSYQYVNRLVFTRSYLKGTISGLREKYNNNKIEMAKDAEYALMVTNYDNALVEYVEKNIGKLVNVKNRKDTLDTDAFEKGKKDAKKHNHYKRLM